MEQLAPFIMNHIGLWLALALVLVLLFVNEFIDQKKRPTALSTAAAIEMINHHQATVIDLRDLELFRAGHIINAIQVSADEFKHPRMNQYKTKPLILVCARGTQSTALAPQLRKQGFESPMVLAGGMATWLSDNLPLVKSK